MCSCVKHGGPVRLARPIDTFFKQYQQFDYNPHAEAWSEYRRMSAFLKWTRNSKKERKANHLFREAIVAQFGALYGVDEKKLDDLQRLCEKLEISPMPQCISSCQKAVRSVHVNIMDFVDCERTGRPVRKFTHLGQLQRYTRSRDKFFPLQEAKGSSLLRFLLRTVR
ncbi:hypothetical protein E4U42_007102 [Claviceps africana]|uniref:Uncharacterized protein n=1 Tax=Claviceps africana TaxID=83212 RepID=A0A8K0J4C5_9HYPO|nr:hypothetical protein E4U42_007102 [Claviceps africana]